MKFVYLLSVYIHILCAALWIGGMLFLILVLLPAIKNNPHRRELIFSVGMKFRFVGWIALILLLCTGLYNMYYRGVSITQVTDNSYSRLFGYKLLLFFVVVSISAYHDFYSGPKSLRVSAEDPKSKKLIRTARIIGELNLLLALIAAGFGVAIVRGI